MYTLFAYTRDPAHRIIRFAMDQTVQEAMTAYLEQQVSFFDRGCEEFEFDGKYKPDDGEILVINGFDDIDDLSQVITSPVNIPIADPKTTSFDSIKALFFGKSDDEGIVSVYFQNFDRRKVISGNGFSIFHARDRFQRMEGTGLTLDYKIAAKLRGNVLKFCSFFHVKQIFDMTDYFRDATDADIKDFVEMKQVSVGSLESVIAISDSWVRRKLWLVRQSGILERVPPGDIKAIAAEFNIAVVYENIDGEERIKIPEDKHALKTLLRFLDEDYYKSPLSQRNFITNSKRMVS